MRNIKLSVVIPTKNRYEYLQILIKSLLESQSNEYEIIIHDNSDDNSLFLDFLEENKSPKLKYFYVPEWISVVENCERGVMQATGEYVCMLGDDDGILLDESIEELKKYYAKNVDAIVTKPAFFSWPDNSHAAWNNLSGKLSFHGHHKNDKKVNILEELKKQNNKGFGFGLGILPRVYHGFVLNSRLKELRNDCGTAFPGPSPDMANAIGLTKYIKNCIYTFTPLIISGHAKKSTGGQGGNKNHHGNIESQKHLPDSTAKEWSNKIPFFWSGPTIYAESARIALNKTNRNNPDRINYNYLYAICLVYEKTYKYQINQTIIDENLNTLNNRLLRQLYFVEIWFNRGVNYFRNILKYKVNRHLLLTAADINEAMEMLRKTK